MTPDEIKTVALMAAALKRDNQTDGQAADDAKGLFDAVQERAKGLWTYEPPKACPSCGDPDRIRPGRYSYTCGGCGHMAGLAAEYPSKPKVVDKPRRNVGAQ